MRLILYYAGGRTARLRNNEAYVKLLYKDLNYVETFVDERYWNSFNDFITILTLMKQENIPIHKSHEN